MVVVLRRLLRDEAGQDLIEYALLAAFISIIALTIVQAVGVDVTAIYGVVGGQTTAAATAAS